jgi:hypothetical protein
MAAEPRHGHPSPASREDLWDHANRPEWRRRAFSESQSLEGAEWLTPGRVMNHPCMFRARSETRGHAGYQFSLWVHIAPGTAACTAVFTLAGVSIRQLLSRGRHGYPGLRTLPDLLRHRSENPRNGDQGRKRFRGLRGVAGVLRGYFLMKAGEFSCDGMVHG